MSHPYNNQSNSSGNARHHGEQQYSAQGYPANNQYSSQQGQYQTLSSTTQGYASQPGAAYNVAPGASYSSGGAVPYPGVHPVAEGRSGSGHQYSASSQYAGHTQQAAGYPGSQYSYAPQAGHPPVSPHSSRYLPPASGHARRSSASSLTQVQGGEMDRYPCPKCDKTFSRAHDQKRHFETQHTSNPPIHTCMFCHKGFSRNDSLKRHVDNGCDKDPSCVCGPSSA